MQYQWDDGAITKNRSGLSSGQYCVKVSDANSCSFTECFSVDNNTLEAYIASVTNNTNCDSRQPQGYIDVEVPSLGSFTFNWIGPNGFTAQTEDVSSLQSGEYIVTITDDTGCRKILSAYICCCGYFHEPEEGSPPHPEQCQLGSEESVTISSYTLTQIGLGNDKGAIDIEVKGGSQGSKYYNWTGPNGYKAYTKDIDGLEVGTYCVLVTDGCSSTSKCFTIVDCDANPISVTGNITETCDGVAAGIITLTISGGTSPYTIIWSNGEDKRTINGLNTGEYCVTVSDVNECESAPICFFVGTHPGQISTSTVPCTRTVHCNGQDFVEYYGYTQWLECNTLYSYCPITGQTISQDLGWAGTEVIGCNLYGICQDGNVQLLEQGWLEYGPFPVQDPNCPYGIGCIDYACYIPGIGYVLEGGGSNLRSNGYAEDDAASRSSGIYCSTVLYSSDPRCGELDCWATILCGSTVVAGGCVSGGTTSCGYFDSPEDFTSLGIDLFKELNLTKVITSNAELLQIVNQWKASESGQATASAKSTLDIPENLFKKPASSKVYPNPFSHEIALELSLNQPSNITITITNILGEKLLVDSWPLGQGINKKEITLSDLQSGLYFLQIYDGSELLGIHKILKN